MSWVGLIGSVAVCVAVYAVLAASVTAQRFAAAPQRFMSDRWDVYPFLKAAVLNIAANPHPNTYRVLLIGDSGLREALSSIKELRRAVDADAAQPVEVTPLIAGGLTQLEAVDLCGTVCGHMRGRVILEISPYLAAKGQDADLFEKAVDRLGYDSPDLAEEFDHAGVPRPRWTNNFFLRNYRFMLAHSAAFLRGLSALPEPEWHNGSFQGLVDGRTFAHDAARIRNLTHGMARRAPETMAVYGRLIHRLQAAGIEVTLLEAPRNPRLLKSTTGGVALGEPVLRTYAHWRAALCHDTRVAVWDLNGEAALESEDFHDAYHVIDKPARGRFTDALAAHIVRATAEGSR